MLKCNCCYELVEQGKIAYCKNCKESGQMCHECVLKWGNENNDITICSICKKKETMYNLPFFEEAMVVQPDNVLIEDSWCKCLGRWGYWLLLWVSFTFSSGSFCMLFFFRAPKITEWSVCISALFSYIFLWRYREWFIMHIMPASFHYDGII